MSDGPHHLFRPHSKPRLSVVIPAYNEENRIPATLARVADYLENFGVPWEMIVVDDGSRDGTAAVAGEFGHGDGRIRVLSNGTNRGKGFSVRRGMLEAKGGYRIFSDADLSTPIDETERLVRALRRGAEVAVASRRLGHSRIEVKQPWYREMMGRSFNLVVQTFAVRGVSDTQCGFKGFTARAAAGIFGSAAVDRFGFDVEILYLARKMGLRIVEVPVKWIDDADSRVDPLKDPFRMFMEVLQVRRNEWKGVYRNRRPGGMEG